MRARPAALLLTLAVPLTLTACAGGDGGGDTLLVGVAMPTTTSDRWIGDGDRVRAQLEALGHDVDLQYAEDDAAAQADQIDAMIDAGADALVVAAVDGTRLRDVLARAGAADIPVVSYDRLIRDSPDVDLYASFDNRRVGVQQATSLLQGLGLVGADGRPTGQRGPFTLEVFAGSSDDNNAGVFFDAAMDVLQPWLDRGDLVVVSGQTDFADVTTQGWSGDVAAERMETLMPRYADRRLDAILSPYDGISRALLDVVGTAGYGTSAQPWPVVTGQDAEVESVRSLAAGEQHSTVFKDLRQLAEVAVGMVEDLLDGDEPVVNDVTTYDNGVRVVPAYLLAPQVVTAGTVQSVLVDSGFYTPEELS